MTIRGLAVRRHDSEMVNKGKARSRKGRSDFMRAHGRQEGRTLRQAQARTASCPQVRQQRAAPGKSASNYDKAGYDGSQAASE